MLNYIKVELWKVSRRRGFYAAAGVFLGLTHLFGFMYTGDSFEHLVHGVCATMLTGFAAAPVLVQLVDGRFGDTVRNEVSFGLSREEIYLGKLFSGILIGAALCAVLVGGVLLSGWVLLDHGKEMEELRALMILAGCLTAALPIWCGMVGLCHMLATLIRSQSVWLCAYFLGFMFCGPLAVGALSLLAALFDAVFRFRLSLHQPHLIQSVCMPWTLLLSDRLGEQLTPAYLLLCWRVGLGWLLASSAAGLLIFRRRDIR